MAIFLYLQPIGHEFNRCNVEFFEKIIKVLGMIAGITGVVSTILSALGFIVLRSHANLLGLSSIFYHSVGDYLYEGGIFFANLIFWALPASIMINFYGFWSWLTIVFVLFITLYLRLKDTNRIKNIDKKIKHIITPLQKSWFRWIYFIFAIIIITFCIHRILPSSAAKDLLFVNIQSEEIIKRISQQNIEEMEIAFTNLIHYIIISVLLIFVNNKIINKHFESEAFSKISKKLLYSLLVVELFMLPIKYGQIAYSNEFHSVREIVTNDQLSKHISNNEKCFLISRNPDSFIFYAVNEQKIIWIQQKNVNILSLGERVNILKWRVHSNR